MRFFRRRSRPSIHVVVAAPQPAEASREIVRAMNRHEPPPRIDGTYLPSELLTIDAAAHELDVPKHEVFKLIRRRELNGGFDDFVMGFRVTAESVSDYQTRPLVQVDDSEVQL